MTSETSPEKHPDPSASGGQTHRGSGAGFPGTGMAQVLSLRDISKTYGVTRALDAVTMTIDRGEIVGLVGHNGAGKSTLMRVIVGLTRTDTGTVSVAGHQAGSGYSMHESRAHGVRIAYQELSLAPDLKVFENVAVAVGRRPRLALAEALPAVAAEPPGRGVSRAQDSGAADDPRAVAGPAADAGNLAGHVDRGGVTVAAHPGRANPLRCPVSRPAISSSTRRN